MPRWLIRDERLHVLAPDVGQFRWHSMGREVRAEATHRVQVGSDRAGDFVLGQQEPLKGVAVQLITIEQG